ncbi:hypothetical protein [Lentzea jiangxiensis]|uniref:SPFH domain / Band 7 family protein n=1 Tax=Lentzea jiangxiensis TaxID=641025 RepID=A0A1H0EGV9_9PSEU|nr:hypothetical protein [Lentzea jiangxiensis]SDN81684.1 hypothetical protein SAMN05421507_101367 [Lentzea jiangxiensis]
MTRPYPIVTHRPLAPSPKRGPLGLGRKFRDADELPKPAAHEVLVFRVDGEYVPDSGRLGLRDDQIIRASHVSLVDMSREAPVMVSVTIQSGEASVFTVHVTFTCTVNDPVVVVRDGVDAATVLHSYLMSHQRLFELGLTRKMSDISTVVRDVSAQVRAYFEIRPITVPGMTIRLAGVEVLTPQELVEFQATVRDREREHMLALNRQAHTTRLAYESERDGQKLEGVRRRHLNEVELEQRDHDRTVQVDDQRHRHDLETVDRLHGYRIKAADERHELDLEGQRRQFGRNQFERDLELINGDTRNALLYALATGSLDQKELVNELRAEADRESALQDSRQARDREYELLMQDREREFQRLQLEEDRYNRDATRAERLRRETADREDERRRFDANVQLVQTLAARGFLDTQNLPVEKILADVLDMTPPALEREVVAGDRPKEIEDERSVADELREENAD